MKKLLIAVSIVLLSSTAQADSLDERAFGCLTEKSTDTADFAVKTKNYPLFLSLMDCMQIKKGTKYNTVKMGVVVSTAIFHFPRRSRVLYVPNRYL